MKSGRKLDIGWISDEIGDFTWAKIDILVKIFLVSLNMLVAQDKINADIKSTLN